MSEARSELESALKKAEESSTQREKEHEELNTQRERDHAQTVKELRGVVEKQREAQESNLEKLNTLQAEVDAVTEVREKGPSTKAECVRRRVSGMFFESLDISIQTFTHTPRTHSH